MNLNLDNLDPAAGYPVELYTFLRRRRVCDDNLDDAARLTILPVEDEVRDDPTDRIPFARHLHPHNTVGQVTGKLGTARSKPSEYRALRKAFTQAWAIRLSTLGDYVRPSVKGKCPPSRLPC